MKITKRQLLGLGAASMAASALRPLEALAEEADDSLQKIQEAQLESELRNYDPTDIRKKAGADDYHGRIAISSSSKLNGQNLNTNSPVIVVSGGNSIEGTLAMDVRHAHGENAYFPVAAVPLWDRGVSAKYDFIEAMLLPQDRDRNPESLGRRHYIVFDERANLLVPNEPGNYHLVVVGAAVAGKTPDEAVENMVSGTHWLRNKNLGKDGANPVFGDSTDVKTWGEKEALHAMKYQFMVARELVGAEATDDGLARYAAAAIRIVVDPKEH